jgi:hypothetical protein
VPFKYKDPDTGETKEFTYDIGDQPDNELTSAEQSPVTPDVGEDTTGWDINKKTKRTLGQYLNRVTHGQEGPSKRGNEFGIDAQQTSLETTDPQGYPVSPGIQHTGENKGTEGYLKNVRDIPELGYKSTSDDYTDAVEKNNFAIHKGAFKSGVAENAASQNGNTLLKSIDTETGDKVRTDPENSKVVTGYVSAVLTHNRFSSFGTQVSDMGGEVSVKMNTEVGKNNLKDDDHIYSQQRLANVGLLLSLRASGEWGSTKDGADPTSGGIELKAILPGFNQLGIDRIGPQDFDVKQIVSTLTTSENVKTLDPAKLSWGALNNVHDQYFGVGAMGMQVLSLTLLVSMLAIFELFGLIFSLLANPEFTKTDGLGRPLLGRYRVNKNSGDPSGFPPKLGVEMLGINPTQNNFRKCVEAGLKAFYGLDEDLGPSLVKKAASAALSAALPTQDSPGQQIAVSRTILRSSLALKDAFSNIGGNPLSIIKGILAVVDVFKRSKFMIAMNLFAALGDQILQNEKFENVLPTVDKALDQDENRNSRVNMYDPDKTSAQQMSRLKRTKILAWGTHRAPMMTLLPTAFISPSATAANLGLAPGMAIAAQYTGKIPYAKNKIFVNSVASGRIATEDREKFERLLDAEYFPFYFHDLRTNEIISFHAFLTSLSDDYTANWETVDGIGRIDPVKIYKNTQRKIGISFFVVSTNESDFDVMWLKINKLLTLIYPQYTRGRMIFDGDNVDSSQNVITQPFSQIVGASPLIRLRIGDLIKSNYSKFILARLFGYGMDEMKVNNVKMNLTDTDNNELILSKLITEQTLLYDGTTLPPGDYRVEVANGTDLITSRVKSDDELPVKVGDNKDCPMPEATELSCKVKAFTEDGFNAKIIFDVKTADEIDAQTAARIKEFAKTFWSEMIGKEFIVPRSSLSYTEKTNNKIMKKNGSPKSDVVNTLQNFMSETDNTLVKSFKNTGGKGLAGVIESMNFAWLENTPWDVSPGNQAPMFCKVTLNFAPIHDISPGLDWQGYNRGFVYPVGIACSPSNRGKK